jgi:hypothetical protein
MEAWGEITVRGSEGVVRAFVAGFLAGRGARPEIVLSDQDVDLEPESLGDRLRDLLVAGSHVVWFAPEPIASGLAAALGERGADLGLHLESHRRIESATFRFRAEAFSRPVADGIRGALLATLPADVAVGDRAESEEEHPEGRAADPYAPLHPYVYRVSDRITGSLPGVLEMQRRAKQLDFVEVGRLHVEGIVVSSNLAFGKSLE